MIYDVIEGIPEAELQDNVAESAPEDKEGPAEQNSPATSEENTEEVPAAKDSKGQEKADTSDSQIASKDNSDTFFTTNDLETAKKGKKGVFAYKRRGRSYDMYYIIDFADKCVYYFTEGNSEECACIKIKSGNLNKGVKFTYHVGGDSWTECVRFKNENDPLHLIWIDADGAEYEGYDATDLDAALKLRDKKTLCKY